MHRSNSFQQFTSPLLLPLFASRINKMPFKLYSNYILDFPFYYPREHSFTAFWWRIYCVRCYSIDAFMNFVGSEWVAGKKLTQTRVAYALKRHKPCGMCIAFIWITIINYPFDLFPFSIFPSHVRCELVNVPKKMVRCGQRWWRRVRRPGKTTSCRQNVTVFIIFFGKQETRSNREYWKTSHFNHLAWWYNGIKCVLEHEFGMCLFICRLCFVTARIAFAIYDFISVGIPILLQYLFHRWVCCFCAVAAAVSFVSFLSFAAVVRWLLVVHYFDWELLVNGNTCAVAAALSNTNTHTYLLLPLSAVVVVVCSARLARGNSLPIIFMPISFYYCYDSMLGCM